MNVIKIAQEKLDSLEKEAVKLRLFIETYGELTGDKSVENVSDEALEISEASENTSESTSSGTESQRRKRGDKPAAIVAAAKEVIIETERPMNRTELVEALEHRGMTIGGTDKSKNMGTIIWRSDQFENVEGVGYWPLELGDWATYNL